MSIESSEFQTIQRLIQGDPGPGARDLPQNSAVQDRVERHPFGFDHQMQEGVFRPRILERASAEHLAHERGLRLVCAGL